jgi:hypothetical protein
VPTDKVQRVYRIRVAVFVLSVVLVVALQTLIQLDMIDVRQVSTFILWVGRLFATSTTSQSSTHSRITPHLPEGAVDAVLIGNTDDELTHPRAILACIPLIRSSGRLIVIDRGPEATQEGARDIETQHHELPLEPAATESRQSVSKLACNRSLS